MCNISGLYLQSFLRYRGFKNFTVKTSATEKTCYYFHKLLLLNYSCQIHEIVWDCCLVYVINFKNRWSNCPSGATPYHSHLWPGVQESETCPALREGGVAHTVKNHFTPISNHSNRNIDIVSVSPCMQKWADSAFHQHCISSSSNIFFLFGGGGGWGGGLHFEKKKLFMTW